MGFKPENRYFQHKKLTNGKVNLVQSNIRKRVEKSTFQTPVLGGLGGNRGKKRRRNHEKRGVAWTGRRAWRRVLKMACQLLQMEAAETKKFLRSMEQASAVVRVACGEVPFGENSGFRSVSFVFFAVFERKSVFFEIDHISQKQDRIERFLDKKVMERGILPRRGNRVLGPRDGEETCYTGKGEKGLKNTLEIGNNRRNRRKK